MYKLKTFLITTNRVTVSYIPPYFVVQLLCFDYFSLQITQSNDSVVFTAIGSVFPSTNGTVTCNATNSEGTDLARVLFSIGNNITHAQSFPKFSGFISNQLIFVVLGVTVFLLICILPIVVCRRNPPKVKPKLNETNNLANSELIIPQQKRIRRKDLRFGRLLGEGEYGVVLMAEAKNVIPGERSTTVAIKKMRYNDDRIIKKAMIAELKIIILIGQHLNIVNFLGAVDEKIQNSRYKPGHLKGVSNKNLSSQMS